MRRFIILIFFIAFILSCNRRNEITEERWIIIDGFYKNQKIEFLSTNLIQITDNKGNINPTLVFYEDGKILLPGINSNDIRANWKIADDKLFFNIDSAKYNRKFGDSYHYSSLKPLMENDSSYNGFIDSLSRVDSIRERIWKETNPLFTNEFSSAMNVYSNPFSIKIEGDFLKIVSITTVIIAYKDSSSDKLFEGL